MTVNENRSSVCFVCIYFGPLPPWFFLHLLTCEYNPDITFLYLIDRLPPADFPPNVTFVQSSIKEFEKFASEKLKVEVNLDFPYKLCDLKPASGIILDDYLSGIDYWAHTDLDSFYGNIRKFLTEELLEKNDLIHSLSHPCGHFTIFRNNDFCNKIFMHTGKWREVFADGATHYRFDEIEMERCLQGVEDEIGLRRAAVQLHASPVPVDVNKVGLKRLRTHHDIIVRHTLPPHLCGTCLWHKGTLTFLNQGKEVMYYHQDYKQVQTWRCLLKFSQFRFKKPVLSFLISKRLLAVYRDEPYLYRVSYHVLVFSYLIPIEILGAITDAIKLGLRKLISKITG